MAKKKKNRNPGRPKKEQQDPKTGRFVRGNTICNSPGARLNGPLGGRKSLEVHQLRMALLEGEQEFALVCLKKDGSEEVRKVKMNVVEAAFSTLVDIMQRSHSDEQRRLAAMHFLEMYFGKPKIAVDLVVSNTALDRVLDMCERQTALTVINQEPKA